MSNTLSAALTAGVERLSAWADLLDQINVFPVADGDTGRNLVVSLAPLRGGSPPASEEEGLVRRLLLSARGNAGNIAARFFAGFLPRALSGKPGALAAGAGAGRSLAWQAVADPLPGTMLTLFDALDETLKDLPPELGQSGIETVVKSLAQAVRSTPGLLPRLREAGVLDAGALGMYLFFEGFFAVLAGRNGARSFAPLKEIFPEGLNLRPASSVFSAEPSGYCIDATLRTAHLPAEAASRLSALGKSVVIQTDRDIVKVHLHVRQTASLRRELNRFGEVLSWKEDSLDEQTEDFRRSIPSFLPAVHIMTDAAGSLTREQARQLGVTLLDSYVSLEEQSLPETSCRPTEVYEAMRRGVRAMTSQASLFERHQLYAQVLERYPRVLYLAVGSVYTGNVAAARDWKANHDPEDRLAVLDTGAASGRLGLLALAVARFARTGADGEAVISFARRILERCDEYLFLDRLQYLADGGRLSRTGARVGDLLHIRPVIRPTPEGAKKVGAVRSREEQLRFALERLAGNPPLSEEGRLMILLEYSDNREWVENAVRQAVTGQAPAAEVLLQPLSLTTGVHTGPGTWGIAFLALPDGMRLAGPDGASQLPRGSREERSAGQ